MTIKTKNLLTFIFMGLVVVLLGAALHFLFSLNQFLVDEINAKAAQSRWLVLVQGDTLQIDEVGRLLAQESDVADVKLISSADVLTTLLQNHLFLQDVTEDEKKNLPPVWQVQWKPFATALTNPEETINEIKTFKNVIDVALDGSAIHQMMVLRRLEHRIRIFKSLSCLVSFLIVLFFIVRLVLIKNWRKSAALLGTILLMLSTVHAEPKASGELKMKNRDLEKINEELSQKKEEKERLKKEEADLTRFLDKNRSKVEDIERTLLYTHEKGSQVGQEMAKSKNSRDRIVENIGDYQQTLDRTRETMVVASLLLGENSAPFIYSEQIYHQRLETLRGMKTNRDSEDDRFSNLTENFKAIQQELHNQESSLADVRTTYQEKKRLREKKLTRQENLEEELRSLEHSKEELAALIDNLRTRAKEEKESEKLARKQKGETGQSPIQTHSLTWPIEGRIRKKFGRQAQSEFGSSFISNGVVINSSNRGVVNVVADGTVLYAGQFMSYGSMVVVEHSGDWFSVYGFLRQWNVEKGSAVKKGDPIGIPGDDPAGGSQVYFELRFYGKPVDPEAWLASSH